MQKSIMECIYATAVAAQMKALDHGTKNKAIQCAAPYHNLPTSLLTWSEKLVA
jgi:hypothetical protein